MGQGAAALGLLAAVRILTGVLTPAEYGTFALGLTFVVLAAQTLFGPLAGAGLRFYAAAANRAELGQFWAGLLYLAICTSFIASAAVAVAFLAAKALGFEVTGLAALCAVVFAIFSGWETLFDYVQSGRRQRWAVAWHQALRQLLRPALAGIFATLAPGERVAWAFAGYATAAGLVLTSQIAFSRSQLLHLVLHGASRYRRQLLRYALPFVGWGVFTWIQLGSDRWALELTAGPAVVGRYAILVQLGAQPLILLGTATAQLFEPVVYTRAGTGEDPSMVRSAFRLNATFAAVIAAGVLLFVLGAWLAHPLIFSLVVAPDYRDASGLLPFAALSGGLFSLAQLLAIGSVVLGTPRMLLAPKIGSAVLGTSLNLVGAYFFGIQGVLLAGILTTVVYATWVALISVKRYRSITG